MSELCPRLGHNSLLKVCAMFGNELWLGALIVFFTATINDPAFPTVDFGGGTDAIQFRAVCIPRRPYGQSYQYLVVCLSTLY